jgi:hypothetical protein
VLSLGPLVLEAAIAICAALIVVACRLLILVLSHRRLRPLAGHEIRLLYYSIPLVIAVVVGVRWRMGICLAAARHRACAVITGIVAGLFSIAAARGSESHKLAIPTTAFAPAAPRVSGGHLNGSALIQEWSRADVDRAASSDGYADWFPAIAGQARCAVRLLQIDFTTSAPDGASLANASAAVLVPTGSDPRCVGPRPLLVMAPGTQPEGVRNADMSHWATRECAIFYAAQGVAVVLPDYLGDGDRQPIPGHSRFAYHPYFHAQSEGTTLLDSIRAVRALPLELSGTVMFGGGSQGAHAALAALMLARAYYPGEFEITAAALNAGPFDLPAEMELARTTPTIRPIYDKALAAWTKLYDGSNPLSTEEVARAAAANDLARAQIPELGFQVLLCSTTRDDVVPIEMSQAMASKLGPRALPVMTIPPDAIDRGAAVFAPLHRDAHSIGGTLCIAEEWSYFDARAGTHGR